MAPEYSGRGDAVRSMELLWGRGAKPSRGPKPGTELETVVRTAIELADAEGLDAVSMRRIAERLGIGTMSVYTYVPGKAELLDLMLDTVYGERAREPFLDAPTTRAQLEGLARSLWEFHKRHPWTLYIATGRSVLGPNEFAAYESALSIVADLGMSARDAVALIDSISIYVRGAARDAVEAIAAESATGKSEYEWWTERSAILADVMTYERYPTVSRLGEAGGFSVPDDAPDYTLTFTVQDFEFGLQRLLDGIEAYLPGR